ncbi:LytR C-terminal domain-containing protein, partial [Arthrobacter sp.]
ATSDGWTVSQTGNWNGAPQSVSSIIYSGPAQKANAEALGKLLNIATLLDSAEMGIPLTIVLGPGA